MSEAVPTEPFLSFPVDRSEARHLLRALNRAAAYAVRAATVDDRAKAKADADAYDDLRARLLDDVVRRDLELDLDDEEDES